MTRGTPAAALLAIWQAGGSYRAAHNVRSLRGRDQRPLDDGRGGRQDVLLQQLRGVRDRSDGPGRPVGLNFEVFGLPQ